MKLSISNIAWSATRDKEMYEYLKEQGIQGLEIAPTRIFPSNPYDKIDDAKNFADKLEETYGISVSSIQSVWFGKKENIFGSDEERQELIRYTKKSVGFAAAVRCRNIVFGCPKNRNLRNEGQYPIAVEFFREIGEYAAKMGTVIAIEPNPPIYNTNFINTTEQAFEITKIIDSAGIKVNLDFGTIIQNDENMDVVKKNIKLVNHVHISEPFLEQIKIRKSHAELAELLTSAEYKGFVSIEMKNSDNIELVKNSIQYIKEVFQ